MAAERPQLRNFLSSSQFRAEIFGAESFPTGSPIKCLHSVNENVQSSQLGNSQNSLSAHSLLKAETGAESSRVLRVKPQLRFSQLPKLS